MQRILFFLVIIFIYLEKSFFFALELKLLMIWKNKITMNSCKLN